MIDMGLHASRALAALFMCAWTALASAQPPADAIIARVNGEAILLSQLKEEALDQDLPLSALTYEGLRGEGLRRALTQRVDETLLIQKAGTDGIKPSETDIARRVDEMIRSLQEEFGSAQKLEDFLTERHLALDELRRLLTQRERRRTLATEVVARRITVDAEAIEAFRQRRQKAGESVEEVNLSQILIPCTPEERREKNGREIHLRALSIARQAGAQPARFMQIGAQAGAEGRARGGYLGWIDTAALRPELRDWTAKHQPGDISDPIACEDGYHILKFNERHSTRDLLFGERFEAERTKLIEQLRQSATIRVFEPEALAAGASKPTTATLSVTSATQTAPAR
jgi:parvulin-like peptidyl-prolyl isomerase